MRIQASDQACAHLRSAHSRRMATVGCMHRREAGTRAGGGRGGGVGTTSTIDVWTKGIRAGGASAALYSSMVLVRARVCVCVCVCVWLVMRRSDARRAVGVAWPLNWGEGCSAWRGSSASEGRRNVATRYTRDPCQGHAMITSHVPHAVAHACRHARRHAPDANTHRRMRGESGPSHASRVGPHERGEDGLERRTAGRGRREAERSGFGCLRS